MILCTEIVEVDDSCAVAGAHFQIRSSHAGPLPCAFLCLASQVQISRCSACPSYFPLVAVGLVTPTRKTPNNTITLLPHCWVIGLANDFDSCPADPLSCNPWRARRENVHLEYPNGYFQSAPSVRSSRSGKLCVPVIQSPSPTFCAPWVPMRPREHSAGGNDLGPHPIERHLPLGRLSVPPASESRRR